MPKKRKSQPQRNPGPRPPSSGLLHGLDQAQALIQRKRLVEAKELLESLDFRYPKQPNVLYDLLNVCYDLKDLTGYRRVAERLSRLVSDDPDLDLSLAGAYMSNIQIAKALKAFRRYVSKWPDHARVSDAHRTIKELEKALGEQLEGHGLSGEAGLEIAELNEETMSLLEEGNYAEAGKVAERLLNIKPDFAAALNNLSMVRWLEGKAEQAIDAEKRVLATDPANVHALSNVVRFLCLSGSKVEAEEFAERLKATRAKGSDVWTKKVEGLSYLGMMRVCCRWRRMRSAIRTRRVCPRALSFTTWRG